MNAAIPYELMNPSEDPKDSEVDIVGWLRQGKMAISELVIHAEQLQNAGHPQAASNLYALWLAHHQDPRKHLVWFNHGSLLQQLGQLSQAQQAYQEAIALSPGFAQAHINLGLVLEKQGLLDRAIDIWGQLTGQRYSVEPLPSEMLTTALNHIGRVYENQKRYQQALEALEHSLQVNPRQPGVIQHWVHIRQKACEWPVYKALPGISKNDMIMATSPLAMLALTDEPKDQLLCAHAFVARTYGLKEEFLSKGRAYRHAKTRVGFVSGDFREHAVGFLLPTFFEAHDRNRFELYAYDFTVDDGTAHRQALLSQLDHVRPVQTLNDRQVAELILKDEIDILVDLHGLSSGARPGIFALHPAPHQGTYLGFIGTTGMPWFDFVIADQWVLPPENTEYFMEKPLYVEGSFMPIAQDVGPTISLSRNQLGIPEAAYVMAAFGNVYKITPEIWEVWMQLLEEIPGALLWLIDDNPLTTANLLREAKQMGVSEDKIVFSARCAHEEFKARLRLSDIFLDTYPYNCGSTTVDALNAGIPIVSRYGQTMVSRMGLSLMSHLEVPEFAVSNFEDYKTTVIRHSRHLGSQQWRRPPLEKPMRINY